MIIRGDFKWENDMVGSKVIFVPNDNGRFLIGTNENKK